MTVKNKIKKKTVKQKLNEGGLFVGPSHAEGGIKFKVEKTGELVEVEGEGKGEPNEHKKGEFLVCNNAMANDEEKVYKGKPAEILDEMNSEHGCNGLNEKAEKIKGGESVINRRSVSMDSEFECEGTPEGIASAINQLDGRGVKFSGKGKCKLIKKSVKDKELAKDGVIVAEKGAMANGGITEWDNLPRIRMNDEFYGKKAWDVIYRTFPKEKNRIKYVNTRYTDEKDVDQIIYLFVVNDNESFRLPNRTVLRGPTEKRIHVAFYFTRPNLGVKENTINVYVNGVFTNTYHFKDFNILENGGITDWENLPNLRMDDEFYENKALEIAKKHFPDKANELSVYESHYTPNTSFDSLLIVLKTNDYNSYGYVSFLFDEEELVIGKYGKHTIIKGRYPFSKFNLKNGGNTSNSINAVFKPVDCKHQIFAVIAENSNKLSRIFVRIGEHYDGSKFKDKIFSLDEFKEYWKEGHDGKFTYYDWWFGFNVPDYSIKAFTSGKFDPLLPEEKWLVDNIKSKVDTSKPFYIVGYATGNDPVRRHELAHALYYLSQKYKKAVDKVIDSIPKSELETLTKFLDARHYHKSVYKDEMQAYLLADKKFLQEQNGWKDSYEKYCKKLNDIFDHAGIPSAKRLNKMENGGKTDDFASSNKNRKFISTKITKNEIRNVISGTGKVSNGNIIQAALIYIRRKAGANPSSSKTKSELESEIITEFIDQNNLWYNERLDDENYIGRGVEQLVYEDPNSIDFVVKTNNFIFYNSWDEYLINLLLHNYFFPDTAYELIGFNRTDRGKILPVVRQAFIEKNKDTDLNEVEIFLLAQGFIRVHPLFNVYENKELGITIGDLHDGNVLTKNNLLYFIDTKFFISIGNDLILKNGGKTDDFDSSEKNRIFIPSKITKDELQSIISGTSQVANGNLIQTALNYIRREEGANSINRRTEPEIEKERLIEFVNRNNLWYTGELNTSDPLGNGSEHILYKDPKDENFVFKTNNLSNYSSCSDYLINLLLNNTFFPVTSYELIGFKNEHGNILSVVRQYFVPKATVADLQDVQKYLFNRGFRKVHPLVNAYRNWELGIILGDLHNRNILLKDDTLFFIDTKFFISHNVDYKYNNGGKTGDFADSNKNNLTNKSTKDEITSGNAGDVSRTTATSRPISGHEAQHFLQGRHQFEGALGIKDMERRVQQEIKRTRRSASGLFGTESSRQRALDDADFLENKFLSGGIIPLNETIDDSEYKWIKTLDEIEENKEYALEDIIKHNKLFQKYPDFRKIIVIFGDITDEKFSTDSYISIEENIININLHFTYYKKYKHEKFELRKTDRPEFSKEAVLLHEINHAIQYRNRGKAGQGYDTILLAELRYNNCISEADSRRKGIWERIEGEATSIYFNQPTEQDSLWAVDSWLKKIGLSYGDRQFLFYDDPIIFQKIQENRNKIYSSGGSIKFQLKQQDKSINRTIKNIESNSSHEIKIKTRKKEYVLPIGDITAEKAIKTVKHKYPTFKEFEYKGITYKKTGIKGEFLKKIEPPEVIEARWKKKKERIHTIANDIQKLRNNISRDLKNTEDEKTFLTALIISIIDRTAERIGNDDSAKDGHLGVTGFQKKNATLIGNKILLCYTGKSGVDHEKAFSDERICKALRKAIKNSPSKFIFTTTDGLRIRANHVNDYLKEFGISAKDLRGFSANSWMIKGMEKIDPIEDSDKKRKSQFNKVLKMVAAKVGHGPSTLRKHYLMPELIDEFINNGKILDIKEYRYQDGGRIPDMAIIRKAYDYYNSAAAKGKSITQEQVDELISIKRSGKISMDTLLFISNNSEKPFNELLKDVKKIADEKSLFEDLPEIELRYIVKDLKDGTCTTWDSEENKFPSAVVSSGYSNRFKNKKIAESIIRVLNNESNFDEARNKIREILQKHSMKDGGLTHGEPEIRKIYNYYKKNGLSASSADLYPKDIVNDEPLLLLIMRVKSGMIDGKSFDEIVEDIKNKGIFEDLPKVEIEDEEVAIPHKSSFDKILKDKKIRINDISKATGISHQTLLDLQYGPPKKYRQRTLSDIASYLGVSVKDIMKNGGPIDWENMPEIDLGKIKVIRNKEDQPAGAYQEIKDFKTEEEAIKFSELLEEKTNLKPHIDLRKGKGIFKKDKYVVYVSRYDYVKYMGLRKHGGPIDWENIPKIDLEIEETLIAECNSLLKYILKEYRTTLQPTAITALDNEIEYIDWLISEKSKHVDKEAKANAIKHLGIIFNNIISYDYISKVTKRKLRDKIIEIDNFVKGNYDLPKMKNGGQTDSARTIAVGALSGDKVNQAEENGWEFISGDLVEGSDEYWDLVASVGGEKAKRLLGRGITIRKKPELELK